MTYSKIIKYMSNIFIILSCLITHAHAQQNPLAEETREMREQYSSSDLGRFVKNNVQDARKIRLFINQLHSESLRLSSIIQQNLAKKRETPNYRDLYMAKKQEFVSLRYCIAAQKYLNDVMHPARMNGRKL